MLEHPLHLWFFSNKDSNVAVLIDFKYVSILKELVGGVCDSWPLKTDPVSITLHSTNNSTNESFCIESRFFVFLYFGN